MNQETRKLMDEVFDALGGSEKLLQDAQDIMRSNIIPNGVSNKDAIADYIRLLDNTRQRAVQSATYKALAHREAIMSALDDDIAIRIEWSKEHSQYRVMEASDFDGVGDTLCCPICGYTKQDEMIHGDHYLCKGAIPLGDAATSNAADLRVTPHIETSPANTRYLKLGEQMHIQNALKRSGKIVSRAKIMGEHRNDGESLSPHADNGVMLNSPAAHGENMVTALEHQLHSGNDDDTGKYHQGVTDSFNALRPYLRSTKPMSVSSDNNLIELMYEAQNMAPNATKEQREDCWEEMAMAYRAIQPYLRTKPVSVSVDLEKCVNAAWQQLNEGGATADMEVVIV